MKIFVSGKYGPHALPAEQRLANTMLAIEAGRELIKKGHMPFIPHFSHFVHEGWGWPGSTSQLWYSIDLEWLRCCDAILMLRGWSESAGARVERKRAVNLGMTVYYGLEDVPL